MEYSSARRSTVFIAISHWRDANACYNSPQVTDSNLTHRTNILTKSIESLIALDVERVVVAVVTNEPNQTARLLRCALSHSPNPVSVSVLPSVCDVKGPFVNERSVLSIGWHPGRLYRHGHYLTWAHKTAFRLALNDPEVSLLIYLEDDILFSNASLMYWYRFRNALACYGLLPGYVRFERKGSSLYVVDQTSPQDARGPSVLLSLTDHADAEYDRVFVGLDNSYQGMYVMDRALAAYHLRYSTARDPVRSFRVGPPGHIRERAAFGPTFDNVPAGFRSSNVIPLLAGEDSRPQVDPSCLIEHMTGNYSASPSSSYGKIKVEDLFSS